MSDVVIGDNCVIALGSVVTHDIPDGEVWGGIPAKRLCSIEEYAEKNLALTPEHDAKYLAEHFREETTRIADERSALRRSHSQKSE